VSRTTSHLAYSAVDTDPYLSYSFLCYTSLLLFFFPSGRISAQIEATGTQSLSTCVMTAS
jgi:hypothetical protein